MELALALHRLWERRGWLAVGLVIAVGLGAAGMVAFRAQLYSAASTQMVVDAPKSALGNMQTSLVPFTNRAVVFARLMVSPQALEYIGQAASVPGSEISAQGPAEIGAPQATHTPSATVDGKLVVPAAKYVLRFDQNPQLPTVDVYAQAPTTKQAVALADGAATGFAKYLDVLDRETNVPDSQRVQIRQLGGAQGGVVNQRSGREIGVLLTMMVFFAWCFGMLFMIRLRANLRMSRGAAAGMNPAAATVGSALGGAPLQEKMSRRLFDGNAASSENGIDSDREAAAAYLEGHPGEFAAHDR
jgi:hypothetical protein